MANPNWVKGKSGNPKGAPRRPEIDLIREAIAETEREKKKSLWKHLIEKCYTDENVLIAVAKKFMPDNINLKEEVKRRIIVRCIEEVDAEKDESKP